MKNLQKLLLSLLILFSGLCVVSCASQALKAPCDANATFCGTKTKINTW